MRAQKETIFIPRIYFLLKKGTQDADERRFNSDNSASFRG